MTFLSLSHIVSLLGTLLLIAARSLVTAEIQEIILDVPSMDPWPLTTFGIGQTCMALDGDSALVGTIGVYGRCTASFVFSNLTSNPKMPNRLPTTYLKMAISLDQEGVEEGMTRLIMSNKRFELATLDEDFTLCMRDYAIVTGLLDAKERHKFDASNAALWVRVVSSLEVLSPDETVPEQGYKISKQQHFPDDIKHHIDAKRWTHAISLIIIAKDIIEHTWLNLLASSSSKEVKP
ncbi:CYFA0S14e00463g1_1 [Cyberlindnera fabianii]|uniref:CYFA0S14e00463g1_1 n=1 Tax=Cyberlindnera fabianii TaxID=36022 RepID=A0A061B8F8_CYBFA|nr:hypothetical protein BON22_4012 [Cyberlindnera fabianii]CDR44175.1 CYFA0S14e00463g1_1 [Cyberlindnera fabianii]